ncbi:hypothetical protein JCM10213v2_001056 [Rhodosporidiobolus nylandii]
MSGENASAPPSSKPQQPQSRADLDGGQHSSLASKRQRRRPANLAGPPPPLASLSTRLEPPRRPSEHASLYQQGSHAASSTTGSVGGDKVQSRRRKGGAKPLFAMGGVFPKHAPRRRKSSVAKEQEQEEARRTSGQGSRFNLPVKPQTYASSNALLTAAPSTLAGASVRAVERGDPFEELGQRPSQLEAVASRSENGENGEDGVEGEDTQPEQQGGQGTTAEQPSQPRPGTGSSATVTVEDEAPRPSMSDPPASAHPFENEADIDARTAKRLFSQREQNNWPKDGGEQPGIGGELDQEKSQFLNDFEEGEELPIRNYWGTIRYALREPLAEFLGTLVLIVIGAGADCQTKISSNTPFAPQQGAASNMQWSWGFGTMTAIYIAGGISLMVPRYILAQVLGAFCGALIIWGNYYTAIHQYDPYKTVTASDDFSNVSATLFVTAPSKQAGSTAHGFCQEVLASAILSMAVLALGDENNAPPGAGLGAIVLGFVVVAIGMSNGYLSGYAINGARDFGPRLALWCVGYGRELWTHDGAWWISGAICGPLVGAVAGAFAYDLCIFTGPGSPLNYTSSELYDASGLPVLHNMARVALSPSLRGRKADDLAEAGLAPPLPPHLPVSRSRTPHDRQADEVALSRRWRKGMEKVEREEEALRKRRQEEVERWRSTVEQKEEGVRRESKTSRRTTAEEEEQKK